MTTTQYRIDASRIWGEEIEAFVKSHGGVQDMPKDFINIVTHKDFLRHMTMRVADNMRLTLADDDPDMPFKDVIELNFRRNVRVVLELAWMNSVN